MIKIKKESKIQIENDEKERNCSPDVRLIVCMLVNNNTKKKKKKKKSNKTLIFITSMPLLSMTPVPKRERSDTESLA